MLLSLGLLRFENKCDSSKTVIVVSSFAYFTNRAGVKTSIAIKLELNGHNNKRLFLTASKYSRLIIINILFITQAVLINCF